jgi:hypothetical protein
MADPSDLWDEDGWQSYKDGVATGLLSEDGSQREPDEPDWEQVAYAQHSHEVHAGSACDCPLPPLPEPAEPGDPNYAERPPF